MCATRSRLLATALLVAAVASACGGAGKRSDAPPALPAEVVAQAAAGEVGEPAAAEPASLPALPDIGRIPAGSYATVQFESPFSFSLGEGWLASGPEGPDSLIVDREAVTLEKRVWFFSISEIYEPDGTIVPAPEDIVAWLRAHPDLEVAEPEPVTVGGLSGVQVDFDAVAASAWVRELGKCSTVPSCVPLATGVVLQQADTNRLLVLDQGGKTVLIWITARSDSGGQFLQEATDVLGTVSFR